METSSFYVNEEGELCYRDEFVGNKETLYVVGIFENIFGIIFNVYPKKK